MRTTLRHYTKSAHAADTPFASIRKEMEQSQAAAGGDNARVDSIFEIPLKVAQSIVGFKHDEVCSHLVDDQYVVLSRPATGGGFFGRLFRK